MEFYNKLLVRFFSNNCFKLEGPKSQLTSQNHRFQLELEQGNMGPFILASMQGNNLNGELLLSAVLPLLKLLSMAAIGLLLAHPKYQIVPKPTFTFLSKLVFAVFLPCLIFTNLGPSISVSNLLNWWFIPVNVFISTSFGCVLGVLVAIICRPPPEFFRFTVIMTAFGNTGNLPLAIVASVCHSDDSPFGTESVCTESGVSYVSFSQWVSVILVYTLVYHMMEPTLERGRSSSNYASVVLEEEEEDHGIHEQLLPANNGNGNGNDNDTENDVLRPLLVEAEWPGLEDKETEHCKTPFIARLFNSSNAVLSHTDFPDLGDEEGSHQTTSTKATSAKSIKCLAEPKMVRKIRSVAGMTPIHGILQPPTIASLMAIIIGMIPKLKSWVFDDDQILSFITDSLEILAEAMVPSAVLVLGGMLAEGPNESKLGVRTTVGIIVARLFVLPLIGIGVIRFADKLDLLVADDQLYRFVLLLQYTTPTAILLGAVASLRGYAINEASALLFWQHVVAVFSLSFYIIVYFYILF